MTHLINPTITSRQKQIIMGTIMGGSSIVKFAKSKNCYLAMRSKNKKWIEYKASELYSLSSSMPMTMDKTNRWHSLCYPIFNEMRERFYKNNERFVDIEILSEFTDIALGIWFFDCGELSKKGALFNTNMFGTENTNKIIEYFALLGWASEVKFIRKSLRICLDEKATTALLKIITSVIPAFANEEILNTTFN